MGRRIASKPAPRRNENAPARPSAAPRQNENAPVNLHDMPRQIEDLAPQQNQYYHHSSYHQQSEHRLEVLDAQYRDGNMAPVMRNMQSQSENAPHQHPHHPPFRQPGRGQFILVPPLSVSNPPRWSENMPPQHSHHSGWHAQQPPQGQHGPAHPLPNASPWNENMPPQYYQPDHFQLSGQHHERRGPYPAPDGPGWSENVPPEYYQGDHFQPSGQHHETHGPAADGPRRNESFRFEPYARPQSQHGPVPGHHGVMKGESVAGQGFYDHRSQMQSYQQPEAQKAGTGDDRPKTPLKLHTWLHPLPKIRPSRGPNTRPGTSRGLNEGASGLRHQPAQPLGEVRKSYPNPFNSNRYDYNGPSNYDAGAYGGDMPQGPYHPLPTYDNHHGKNPVGSDKYTKKNRSTRPVTPTPPRPIPTPATRLRPHPPPAETHNPVPNPDHHEHTGKTCHPIPIPDHHEQHTGETTDEETANVPAPKPQRKRRPLPYRYMTHPSMMEQIRANSKSYQFWARPKIDPVQLALSRGRHPLPTSRPAKYNVGSSVSRSENWW